MRSKLMSTAIWTVGRALALQHRGFRMMSTCSTYVLEQPTTGVIGLNPVVFPAPPAVQRVESVARLNAIEVGSQLQPGTHSNSPVVIMHGLLGNAKNFRIWGEKLSSTLKRPRRILALDLRNHGSSEHRCTMTYPDMVHDLKYFLDENQLENAVLIGHSMGGKVAAMTALLHQNLVSGLVVLDIAPVSYLAKERSSWGQTEKVITAIRQLDLSVVKSRRDADRLLNNEIDDPRIRAFVLTNLKKVEGSAEFEWRVNVEPIYRSMYTLSRFCMDDDACPSESYKLSYDGDALFLAGSNSRYISSKHIPDIQKMFPSFAVQSISEAGHWIHIDQPISTINAVADFVDRLS